MRYLQQLFLNAFLKIPSSRGWIRFGLRNSSYLQRALCIFGDNTVNYRLNGFNLALPFSHDLPYSIKLYPNYGRNLGTVTRVILHKYSQLKMIDVGANVGDSQAFCQAEGYIPALCVEGEERMFALLIKNVARYAQIISVQAFLGEDDSTAHMTAVLARGTARLTADSAQPIRLKTLSSLVEEYPEFRMAKFLKVDTDGFDPLVLRGGADFIRMAQPIIFFEFAPFLLDSQSTKIFSFLAELGYEQLLIYDNLGDFLLQCKSSNQELLQELDHYLRTRVGPGAKYFDICAFHAGDVDIAIELRTVEMRKGTQAGNPGEPFN